MYCTRFFFLTMVLTFSYFFTTVSSARDWPGFACVYTRTNQAEFFHLVEASIFEKPRQDPQQYKLSLSKPASQQTVTLSVPYVLLKLCSHCRQRLLGRFEVRKCCVQLYTSQQNERTQQTPL